MDWRGRVNPVFVRKWSADKSLRQVHLISDQEQQRVEFQRAFEEQRVVSHLMRDEQSKLTSSIASRVWGRILEPLEGETAFQTPESERAYALNPEASNMFRILVFLKHGVTFRRLIYDIETNHSEYRRLIDVHRDYYRMLIGKKPLGGLKLRFNYDHFALIVQGLDFGLDKLNELELAACLDEICPCAQKHSVGYLKWLRGLIKNACEALVSSTDRTSWQPPID